MRFLHPEWFFLLPLIFAVGWAWPRFGLRRPWRLICLSLLALLLSTPQFRLRSDGLDLWVLVDRSDSAKDTLLPKLSEWELLLDKSKGAEDRLHFVDYAQESVVRGAQLRAGAAGTVFEGKGTATRTASALRLALAQMDPARANRLLLLSDGFSTEPLDGLAERLLRQEVSLDYRIAGSSLAGDVRIAAFHLPQRVQPNEAFTLEIVAMGEADAPVPMELLRNGQSLGKRTITLNAGVGRLRLTDRVATPGSHRYEARLLPTRDALPGNNAATQWVKVEGGPRVLLATAYVGDPVTAALRAQGFEVEEVSTLSSLNVGQLSGVKVVILNNVPAYQMPNEFVSALKFFVNDQGGGLLMVGGAHSFASGGWFGSAVEPLLPVSMELKQEHRKLAVAMAIVIDRSGSMAMTAPGTNLQKIELACEGAARAIQLLGDSDQVTVIPTDSAAHVVAPLAPLGANRGPLTSLVRRIDSQGGGIFVYTGLREAWKELQKADVGQRHVILFADAADAEEPGQYVTLLADMLGNKCTVSVIGMGTDKDPDADFLKDVAKRGGGRIFFQADAKEIPAIFEQETVAIARAQFIKEPVPVKGAPGWMELASSPMAWLPQADGYNLTYLKPGAAQAAITGDEYAAPLLAFWQRGTGRAAAVTFPLGGDFSAQTRAWKSYGDLVQSVTRWLLGEQVPAGLGLRFSVDGSRLSTDLFYDDTWTDKISTQAPELIVSRNLQDPATKEPWERLSPGHFRASLDLPTDQWLRGAARVGKHVLPFGPINAAINPEWSFDPSRVNELRGLAQRSGGGERVDLSDVWSAPRPIAWQGIERWLLIALIVSIVIEAWRTRVTANG